MPDISGVSGINSLLRDSTSTTSKTQDPSTVNTPSTAVSTNGILSMNDFYKLMAAQLQNQDMSNPVDNSEMLAQMTQMSMMQAIDTFSQTTMTTYAASLIGQEGTFAVTNSLGTMIGTASGKIVRVDLSGGSPFLYIEGKDTGFELSHLMELRAEGTSDTENPDDGSTEKPDETPDGGSTEKPDETPDSGSTEKPVEKPDGGGTDTEAGGTGGTDTESGTSGSESA